MMNEGANPSPAEKAKQDALFENREPKKIIRIITVLAYMTSVSFVGIVLSAYYIFLWHPPNPRLMHSQAMSAHHEARVDFLVVDDRAAVAAAAASTSTTRLPAVLGRMVKQPMTIDLLESAAAADDEEEGSLKTRREIVKNVNAILTANFERTRSSSEGPIDEETTAFNGTTENSTTSSPPDNGFTDFTGSSEETTSNEITELPAPTSTTRKTRSLGKKQHQTPFALKHLEVPIKSENARRKSLRFLSSTTRASADETTSG